LLLAGLTGEERGEEGGQEDENTLGVNSENAQEEEVVDGRV